MALAGRVRVESSASSISAGFLQYRRLFCDSLLLFWVAENLNESKRYNLILRLRPTDGFAKLDIAARE